jgi:hypothetical protein
MWKLGTRPRSSISGNTQIGPSLQCIATLFLYCIFFFQTDTLPEENRSGDGNSSTRKKVAQFLSQLNCTLLQEGAEAKFAKQYVSQKALNRFQLTFSKKLSDIATNFVSFFLIKRSLFQVGCIRIRSVIGIILLSPILYLGPSDPSPIPDSPFLTEKYVHFCKFYPFKGLCHVMNNLFEGLKT